MEFNNKEFKNLRTDIESALQEVEKKYGIKLTCGAISYGVVDFTVKLNGVKNDGNTDGQKALFEERCRYYGFEPKDYERELVIGKNKYKLVGFNVKARTNPCEIQRVSTGQIYTCNPEMVRFGFTQAEKG